jgi:hypothetical protein
MMHNFDGRTFRVVENSPGGEVGNDTIFHFRQIGRTVYADYAGGEVLTGKIIGTLEGDAIRFEYLQVNVRGVVRGGKADDRVELLPDGKLRLSEEWEWKSEDGTQTLRGVSRMEEA